MSFGMPRKTPFAASILYGLLSGLTSYQQAREQARQEEQSKERQLRNEFRQRYLEDNALHNQQQAQRLNYAGQMSQADPENRKYWLQQGTQLMGAPRELAGPVQPGQTAVRPALPTFADAPAPGRSPEEIARQRLLEDRTQQKADAFQQTKQRFAQQYLGKQIEDHPQQRFSRKMLLEAAMGGDLSQAGAQVGSALQQIGVPLGGMVPGLGAGLAAAAQAVPEIAQANDPNNPNSPLWGPSNAEMQAAAAKAKVAAERADAQAKREFDIGKAVQDNYQYLLANTDLPPDAALNMARQMAQNVFGQAGGDAGTPPPATPAPQTAAPADVLQDFNAATANPFQRRVNPNRANAMRMLFPDTVPAAPTPAPAPAMPANPPRPPVLTKGMADIGSTLAGTEKTKVETAAIPERLATDRFRAETGRMSVENTRNYQEQSLQLRQDWNDLQRQIQQSRLTPGQQAEINADMKLADGLLREWNSLNETLTNPPVDDFGEPTVDLDALQSRSNAVFDLAQTVLNRVRQNAGVPRSSNTPGLPSPTGKERKHRVQFGGQTYELTRSELIQALIAQGYTQEDAKRKADNLKVR